MSNGRIVPMSVFWSADSLLWHQFQFVALAPRSQQQFWRNCAQIEEPFAAETPFPFGHFGRRSFFCLSNVLTCLFRLAPRDHPVHKYWEVSSSVFSPLVHYPLITPLQIRLVWPVRRHWPPTVWWTLSSPAPTITGASFTRSQLMKFFEHAFTTWRPC